MCVAPHLPNLPASSACANHASQASSAQGSWDIGLAESDGRFPYIQWSAKCHTIPGVGSPTALQGGQDAESSLVFLSESHNSV